MNLKQKIGQLFVVGFQGTTPSSDFLDFVKEWGIGGTIFFARNLDNPNDLPQVVAKLNDSARVKQFTAIDQEGGLVLRILKHGSLFPGAMALSATNDLGLTRKISKAIAREMRALGMNWNLAPVLDINHKDNPGIGARSFGDEPKRVSEYGCAVIAGFHDGGILACAKHFPGKGHAKIDSHLSLPTIPYSKDRLFSFELFPFQKAITAGVDAIMTAHVFFPAFEASPNLPGTLSKSVLTGLLRESMGFEGLVVTDDLEMGAITESFGVEEAARLSFTAGADLLLICHDLDRQRLAVQTIFDYVSQSPDATARLDQSLLRIQKARSGLPSIAAQDSLDKLAAAHAPIVNEAYEKSILVHRMRENAFPLKPGNRKIFVCPKISSLVQVEETQKNEGLKPLVLERFPDAVVIDYLPKSSREEITKSIEESPSQIDRHCDLIIFSYNAHLFAGQREAFEKVAEHFPNVILIALRNPYDLASIPQAQTAIATFGFRSPAIAAVFRLLSGGVAPKTAPWPVSTT